MELVLLTALGVGGATLLGTIIGFIFKKISHTSPKYPRKPAVISKQSL
jgi:hypothetical protein